MKSNLDRLCSVHSCWKIYHSKCSINWKMVQEGRPVGWTANEVVGSGVWEVRQKGLRLFCDCMEEDSKEGRQRTGWSQTWDQGQQELLAVWAVSDAEQQGKWAADTRRWSISVGKRFGCIWRRVVSLEEEVAAVGDVVRSAESEITIFPKVIQMLLMQIGNEMSKLEILSITIMKFPSSKSPKSP